MSHQQLCRCYGAKRLIAVFAVSALLGLTIVYAKAEAKSECVVCHTDMKRLIHLSWEINQVRPKLDKSAETSPAETPGEG
jgi:hypothetical protein